MYSSQEITTGFMQLQLRLRREAKIFITCHIQVFDIVLVEQIIDAAAQAQHGIAVADLRKARNRLQQI